MTYAPKYTPHEIAMLIDAANAGEPTRVIAARLRRPFSGVETKRAMLVKEGHIRRTSWPLAAQGDGAQRQEPPPPQSSMVASEWTELPGGVRMRTFTAA